MVLIQVLERRQTPFQHPCNSEIKTQPPVLGTFVTILETAEEWPLILAVWVLSAWDCFPQLSTPSCQSLLGNVTMKEQQRGR